MHQKKHSRNKGFTLLEIMIAVLILFAVAGALTTSFLHLHRASVMTSLYSQLHAEIRHSVDVISRDIACSSGISAFPATNDITLICERYTGPSFVRYYLSGNQLYRRADADPAEVTGGSIDGIGFSLFKQDGTATTNPAEAYFIEVYIKAGTGTGKHRAEDMLQIRTLMRNK